MSAHLILGWEKVPRVLAVRQLKDTRAGFRPFRKGVKKKREKGIKV